MKKHILTLCFPALFLMISACSDFLDAKPNKSLAIPDNLDDMEALFNNNSEINAEPVIPLLAADEYFTNDGGILSYQQWQRGIYLWDENPFDLEERVTEWLIPYRNIFNANLILTSVDGVAGNVERKKTLKGTAYFIRAYSLYVIAKIFVPEFRNSINDNNKYIPIPKSPNQNDQSQIGTINEVYQMIIGDLMDALEYLPENRDFPTLPSKKAANALLARLYLDTENYESAHAYSDKTLASGINLMDFNELNLNLQNPFTLFNEEVIYFSRLMSYSFNTSPQTIINPELLNLYEENDLRKQAYFITRPQGNINFTGSYTGTSQFFSGLATDEILLIRAESSLRTGNLIEALEDLNLLLSKRYQKDNFEAFHSTEYKEILTRVLEERRKELVFRGLRWADIKRMNNDPDFQITLRKSIEGEEYILEPQSPRYIFPVPPLEKSFY
jgi:starch-binding outer membrane protein, SusD/RagB family